jgi:hypothetical protein
MDEFSWIIGIIEGEGNFYGTKNGQIQLTIRMTDEDIIKRISNYFGGVKYKTFMPKENSNNLGIKKIYQFRKSGGVTRGELHNFIQKAYPYFSNRRKEQIDKWYERATSFQKHQGKKWKRPDVALRNLNT